MYLYPIKPKSQSQPLKPSPGAYEFVSLPQQSTSTRTIFSTTPLSAQSCTTCNAEEEDLSDRDAADKVVFRD